MAGLSLSFEEMWHLAPSNPIKKLHPVLYSLSMTDCPIWWGPESLLLPWVCGWLSASRWWQTVCRLAAAILMSLACSDIALTAKTFSGAVVRVDFSSARLRLWNLSSRLCISWYPAKKITQARGNAGDHAFITYEIQIRQKVMFVSNPYYLVQSKRKSSSSSSASSSSTPQ